MATESDNVNSGALGTVLAVGTVAFLGIALVVTALVRAETNEEVEKKEVSADRVYRDLIADQTAQLNAPAAYKDRGRGLVSLPIERAMELTVSGLVKDPNSATPPAPIGGSAGAAAEASGGGGAGGSGGSGGSGGTDAAAPGSEQAAPEAAAVGGKGATEAEKKEAGKDHGAKPEKGAPKAPAPAAPAPAPAAPAPAAPTNVPNAP
jgi:hypothetical protein